MNWKILRGTIEDMETALNTLDATDHFVVIAMNSTDEYVTLCVQILGKKVVV
jgi:hypothetical protein